PRSSALVAVLLLAGCLAAPPDEAPGAAAPLPFPDPMGGDHDHSDAALHATSYRMEQTFHHPLAGSATHSAGAHVLDAKGGFLFAGIYGGEADAEGGFFIFDIADPLRPKEVGRYRFPGPLAGDRSLEATEDAQWVVLGSEALDCAGHVNPFAPGLYLIDVRDKSAPKPASYVPATMVHSVTIHRIGGEDYVFTLASVDQNIFRIQKQPVPRLVPVGAVTIGHDSVVVDDPVLRKPLLYASNGNGGFVVHDVSDPARPRQLGEWNIPDRPDDRYYIHTGVVSHIDGRRIAVVTSEDWKDHPSALWVLDATDLSYIETLAQWSAPGDHPAEGLRYSMHNPRILGDDLVLSYYHGGVWSLDLATPASPRVQGLFMPGETNGYRPEKPKTSAYAESRCGAFTFTDAPFTMDVEMVPGAVYAADLHTGLYALKPTW
ncbi:MAG TPA: hypothetical protein VM582_04005, partial [Candidatus Thermoplasmatota archaeon]|nr:hypothetical protein [Candidatus Thermoplasmatota archaeon]